MKFFELFEKYAVRHADSLGMNEQEMLMLLDYWANEDSGNKTQSLAEAKNSAPSFLEIISQLK